MVAKGRQFAARHARLYSMSILHSDVGIRKLISTALLIGG
jgi:hypothetical protein